MLNVSCPSIYPRAAHKVQNYDQLSEQTLAARVCNGAVLSQSAVVAEQYEEVSAYLEGNYKGTAMCVLSLIAWYCTVSKEINGTIDSYRRHRGSRAAGLWKEGRLDLMRTSCACNPPPTDGRYHAFHPGRRAHEGSQAR